MESKILLMPFCKQCCQLCKVKIAKFAFGSQLSKSWFLKSKSCLVCSNCKISSQKKTGPWFLKCSGQLSNWVWYQKQKPLVQIILQSWLRAAIIIIWKMMRMRCFASLQNIRKLSGIVIRA